MSKSEYLSYDTIDSEKCAHRDRQPLEPFSELFCEPRIVEQRYQKRHSQREQGVVTEGCFKIQPECCEMGPGHSAKGTHKSRNAVKRTGRAKGKVKEKIIQHHSGHYNDMYKNEKLFVAHFVDLDLAHLITSRDIVAQ